jgi:hypothetical protein
MTWPEAVSQVVPVLITGVVAVLSARYGARSSIGAAERQVRASLEVAQQNNEAALNRIYRERTVLKREEILGTLYAELKTLHRACLNVALQRFHDRLDTISERFEVFMAEHKEVREYHDRHALWLDPMSSLAIEELLDRYRELVMGDFHTQLIMCRTDADISRLSPARSELHRWAREEYPTFQKTITEGFKASLNLSDERIKDLPELKPQSATEAPTGAGQALEPGEEQPGRDQHSATGGAQEGVQQRSWWRRVFDRGRF